MHREDPSLSEFQLPEHRVVALLVFWVSGVSSTCKNSLTRHRFPLHYLVPEVKLWHRIQGGVGQVWQVLMGDHFYKPVRTENISTYFSAEAREAFTVRFLFSTRFAGSFSVFQWQTVTRYPLSSACSTVQMPLPPVDLKIRSLFRAARIPTY